jgi:cytochrome P450
MSQPRVEALVLLFTSGILYVLTTALYRLYFHPLAKFPGPKTAAVTRLHEFYHQIFRPGRYHQILDAMHDQYGPIVRIGPSEVHIRDPSYYDKLYNFDSELDRPNSMYHQNLQHSPSFETHRMRRKAFDPFFSRMAISKVEWIIRDSIHQLRNILLETQGSGKPINMSNMYRCLTLDIISEYSFSPSSTMLDDPLKNEEFISMLSTAFKLFFLMFEGPLFARLIDAMGSLPDWLQPPSKVGEYLKAWQKMIQTRLKEVAETESDTSRHKTVFHHHRLNPDLPPAEKAVDMQFNNAMGFVSAGFETTGYALSTATYHILSNPSVHSRLRIELASACPRDKELPK